MKVQNYVSFESHTTHSGFFDLTCVFPTRFSGLEDYHFTTSPVFRYTIECTGTVRIEAAGSRGGRHVTKSGRDKNVHPFRHIS